MKQKTGLWLCRGTERRAHYNTELQNCAAIRTHNSPSSLKSVSSTQSYIPSVHFHPGSQYYNLQTNWSTQFLSATDGPFDGGRPESFLISGAADSSGGGWTSASRCKRCQKACRPCRGSELAQLLLPLCRQPLSQGCEIHVFYPKQV